MKYINLLNLKYDILRTCYYFYITLLTVVKSRLDDKVESIVCLVGLE